MNASLLSQMLQIQISATKSVHRELQWQMDGTGVHSDLICTCSQAFSSYCWHESLCFRSVNLQRWQCVSACVCVKGKRLSPTSLCEALINTCFLQLYKKRQSHSMKKCASNQSHDFHVRGAMYLSSNLYVYVYFTAFTYTHNLCVLSINV